MESLPWNVIGVVLGGLAFLLALLRDWKDLGKFQRLVLSMAIGLSIFGVTKIIPIIFTPPPDVLEPKDYGRLLYKEEFDNPQGWDLQGHKIENGSLVMPPYNDIGLNDPLVFTDFIFETQFSFTGDLDGVEFYIRQQHPACPGWNCSIGITISPPYYVNAWLWKNGQHDDPIASATIKPEEVSLQPDLWNKLAIVANGSKYSVYINNVYILSFINSTYKSGTFMLNSQGPTEVKVDYVSIYALP